MFLKLHQARKVDFRSKPWRGQGLWGRHLDAPLNLNPRPTCACPSGFWWEAVVGKVSREVHPGFLLAPQRALKGSQANEIEEAAAVANFDMFPNQTLLKDIAGRTQPDLSWPEQRRVWIEKVCKGAEKIDAWSHFNDMFVFAVLDLLRPYRRKDPCILILGR